MGIIDVTEIRYRALLQRIIKIIQLQDTRDNGFKNSIGKRQDGLEQGHLPHVADAIKIFDQSGRSIEERNIWKCRLKARILPTCHVMYLKRKLQNLEGAIVDCTDENEVIETYEEPSTEIEAPLSEHVVQEILYDLNRM